MKKFLGIGYIFSVIDKGLRKGFREVNEGLQDTSDGIDGVNKKEPKKGSFLTTISEIAKLGLLKSMADGIRDVGDNVSSLQKGVVGKGLSEEFKSFESLSKKLELSLGSADKATKVLNKSLNKVVDTAKVTEETGLEIVGTFVQNNLELEKSQFLLERTGKLTKAFRLQADDVAQSFSFARKTLGFSDDTLKDITDQVTLLQTKTGLEGIVGNLPNALELVQKQIEKGIITPGQAKDQVMRINRLITGFRNTGVEISAAQSFVENLSSSADSVSTAFANIVAGKSGDEIADIAKNFGKLGLNVGDVVKSIKTGNIDKAFEQIRKAGDRATAKGGDTLRAYKILIEDAFGPDALGVIAASNTKAFGTVQKVIKSVDKALKDRTATTQAEKAFETLTDTIEDQEKQLKGLNQRFERGVSQSLEPAIKSYNKFKIGVIQNLNDAEKRNDSYVMSALYNIKRFEQGGLLPFADSISEWSGISTDSIYKVNAAFETMGPIIKDSADELFFFSGAAANIIKILPGKAKLLDIASKSVKGLGLAFRFMLGPVGLIVTGLAALTAGLVYAYKHSETFRNIVDGAWDSVKGLGLAIWDIGKKYLPIAWDYIKDFADFLINWGNPFGLIINGIDKLGELFPSVFGPIKKLIQPIIDLFHNFGGIVSKVGKSISKFFKNSWAGKIAGELLGGGNAPKSAMPSGVSTKSEINRAQSVSARSPIVERTQIANPITEPSPARMANSRNVSREASQREDVIQSGSDGQQMANLMAQMTQQIVAAIQNSGSKIEVGLVGDAKQLFKAQTRNRNNLMVGQGLTG